jgi:hypothetical protein
MHITIVNKLTRHARLGALLGVLASGCVDDDSPSRAMDDSHAHADAGDDHEDSGDERADGGSREDASERPREDAGQTEDDGGAEPDAEAPTAEPIYALVTQVFTADNQTSYLIRHDGALDEGTIDLAQGDEFGGRSLVAGAPYAGELFVGGSESAELTRYALDDQGELSEFDASINFAGRGAASIGEYAGQLVLVSERKAYYFDSRTLSVIIWDPSAMRITGAIDLAQLARSGASVSFSTLAVREDGHVYMPVGYRSLDNMSIPNAAAVVIVDEARDTAEVATDDRCGYVRDAALGPDGKLYLATEAYASAVHRLSENAAPAPCLLRIDPGEAVFDPDFHVDLKELASGAAVGSLLKVPSGKTYVRVLDESAFMVQATTVPRALASAPAWAWKEISLGDDPALTDVVDSPLGSGSMIPLPAGDRMFVPEFSADRSTTTLRDVTEGPSDRTISVPGLVFSLVRLR